MTLLILVQRAIDSLINPVCEEALFYSIFYDVDIIRQTPTNYLIQRYVWLEANKNAIHKRSNCVSLNREKTDIEKTLIARHQDMNEIDCQVNELIQDNNKKALDQQEMQMLHEMIEETRYPLNDAETEILKKLAEKGFAHQIATVTDANLPVYKISEKGMGVYSSRMTQFFQSNPHCGF